ncbi:alkene reductase [Shewanella submarina]|uniref:Alkene reductase n=1 Tax=Shewanella submarina TaxID=2016376 RepID=A0ABV7GDV9_9GAMM|nr:alkene reductase [Shewanella submarina]MCL1038109.1 alkene reductase [Shewanella submarina]
MKPGAEAVHSPLLSPLQLGELKLKNRIVMAPMTRNRADDEGVPTAAMVKHYGDRASAGLIVAEGTWPSREGQAYNRQPGIETGSQIEGWRKVTDAVHQQDGLISLQIMHSGRIGSHHIKGVDVDHIAPSEIRASGEIYTDAAGMQPFDTPRALSTQEVWQQVDIHRQAAKNAKLAGFDAVELHCTSGYLPMQFLCSDSNQRDDEFGGSVTARARFAYECLKGMCEVMGPGRVGIRLNPGNTFNDTNDANPEQSHRVLLDMAAELPLAYVHIMRSPVPGLDAFAMVRTAWQGGIIVNDNFNPLTGGEAVRAGKGDAVSFARHFIANPDLVARVRDGAELARFDRKTLYTPGDKGYNDYPKLELEVEA